MGLHGLVAAFIMKPEFPWSDRELLIKGMLDIHLKGILRTPSHAVTSLGSSRRPIGGRPRSGQELEGAGPRIVARVVAGIAQRQAAPACARRVVARGAR